MLPAPLLRAGSHGGQAVSVPMAEPVVPLSPPAMEITPLAEMERQLILAALEQTGQDVPRAASLLEINASTIYRKLQAWRGPKRAAD
ncbi:helix-turn-helix domain-containing protein [Belnapia arida]